MATVELAAALPVLMLLVLAGLYGVQLADARARCVDAARETARAAARGDPRALELGRRAAGRTAQISVSRGADTVSVVVSITVRPVGSNLPAATLSERAVAATEPDHPELGGTGAGGTPADTVGAPRATRRSAGTQGPSERPP